jgi:FMN-dependent NADH-azoreductase
VNRILYICSSLFGHDSVSNQLADEFLEGLKARNPGARVTTLDLAKDPLPHLGSEEFRAWAVPDEQRSDAQQEVAALSDQLIDALFAHDTLVLAVPMYNLGIPSTLKAWIDRVARAGKTFRYTAEGPKGLVNNVRAYVFFARGGVYRETSLDTQTGHLRAVLGLMGITDVETVYAEGLAMGDKARSAGLAEARSAISLLTMDRTPEVSLEAA